mmetsp:Transcript_47731/g.123777  ORF Transcript_47731/g.123777 Transcript_47731/m.123777 type:complete len:245 (-) Transcript_47731:18-752(-)
MEFPFGKGGQANNFPSFSELGFNEREIALDLDGDSAIEKANDTIFVLSTANKDASFYSPKVSQQSPPAMSPSPSRLPSIYSPSVRDESGEAELEVCMADMYDIVHEETANDLVISRKEEEPSVARRSSASFVSAVGDSFLNPAEHSLSLSNTSSESVMSQLLPASVHPAQEGVRLSMIPTSAKKPPCTPESVRTAANTGQGSGGHAHASASSPSSPSMAVIRRSNGSIDSPQFGGLDLSPIAPS